MTAMKSQPNVLLVLADQLRAMSTPPHERLIPMPAMESMQRDGIRFDNALSSCRLCTPYGGMLTSGGSCATPSDRCRTPMPNRAGRS